MGYTTHGSGTKHPEKKKTSWIVVDQVGTFQNSATGKTAGFLQDQRTSVVHTCYSNELISAVMQLGDRGFARSKSHGQVDWEIC